MRGKALSFKDFAVLEKKGALKKLVGKDPDEELTVKDAKKLGKKIARMDGFIIFSYRFLRCSYS